MSILMSIQPWSWAFESPKIKCTALNDNCYQTEPQLTFKAGYLKKRATEIVSRRNWKLKI